MPSSVSKLDRKVASGAGLDPVDFRDAMSHHTGSVHLITTFAGGEPAGFTANSVTSVSDAPPTLLVCVNKDGECHDAILSAKRFAVNTLKVRHIPLANLFAGRGGIHGSERFGRGNWELEARDVPILTDSLVSFVCALAGEVDAATHTIMIGSVETVIGAKVKAGSALGDEAALLYGERGFRTSTPLPDA